MTKQRTWSTNLLLVLACTSFWLGLIHADEEPEDEAMTMTLTEVVDLMLPLGQSCDPVPERGHVEEMVLNKEQVSHESKCFRRCILLQFEMMPEGIKQYDSNKTLDMMNMMFSEQEQQSRTIIAKCNQANGITDECEIAHSIAMCMLREMRATNYKIPEIKE